MRINSTGNSTMKIDSFVDSYNMASITVYTGNWALECAVEKYTKQPMLSKDYRLFLTK